MSDIMTKDVVTTTEETPIMSLIHLLQERHLIRVPVEGAETSAWWHGEMSFFAYVKARAIYWP